MSRFLRPFSKTRDGSIIVRLRVPERQYLRAMAVGLLEHLSTDDPALERLTPTVYADPDLESEYQGFTGTDLDSSRRAAIEEVLKSIDDKKISAQTAELWMRTFNDLRLVLGTQLGVTEEWRDDMDPEDPRAERYYLYRSLTNVVGALIYAVYEEGNTERGFLFPESDLDDEFNDGDESDDDDDEYDGYDENAYDFDDLDDEDDDDDDDDDYESDQPKDQVDPALIEQLRSIENLGDLEALSGDGGLDRFDPPSTSPDGGPGGS
jgi:hypothetical protein